MKNGSVDNLSAEIDTLQVKYASSVYLSTYSATFCRKDPSALMPSLVYDSISTQLFPYKLAFTNKN